MAETTPRRERRRLSHVDRGGRPRMVDIGAKPPTERRAVAEALIALEQETISLIVDDRVAKGDVLTVAELAGVMSAKRTAELIPLCHPIPLTDIAVEITPDRTAGGLRIRATVATVAATGVEMEALTAATIAALTVYDMVKSGDRGATIRDVRLLEKSGGRSGAWQRSPEGVETTPSRVAPRRSIRARR